MVHSKEREREIERDIPEVGLRLKQYSLLSIFHPILFQSFNNFKKIPFLEDIYKFCNPIHLLKKTFQFYGQSPINNLEIKGPYSFGKFHLHKFFIICLNSLKNSSI